MADEDDELCEKDECMDEPEWAVSIRDGKGAVKKQCLCGEHMKEAVQEVNKADKALGLKVIALEPYSPEDADDEDGEEE